ncbi:MAG: aminotransferase class IV, partial [Anaerolineales bacterium]|nr:aminotransferase class IV [Anaerolineales bacterium]
RPLICPLPLSKKWFTFEVLFSSLLKFSLQAYNQTMIRTWKLTKASAEETNFADMASLDAITRQLPEGYYSTFRTFDGCSRVLGFTAHLRRLYEPVSTPDVDASSLRRQLLTLLEPYRPEEARVRLIMTAQGSTYAAIEPLKRLPREVYEKGVRVEATEMHRESPRLKSTAFIGASDLERKHIAQKGIFEALLVKDGRILEGMTSNFFYVKYRAERSDEEAKTKRKAVLNTARADILLGITRQTVIDIARGRGLEVRYVPLKRDQLAAVNEAFITSSSRGIVPVVQIDQVTIGQGMPGPVTQELAAAYEEYVLARAERI